MNVPEIVRNNEKREAQNREKEQRLQHLQDEMFIWLNENLPYDDMIEVKLHKVTCRNPDNPQYEATLLYCFRKPEDRKIFAEWYGYERGNGLPYMYSILLSSSFFSNLTTSNVTEKIQLFIDSKKDYYERSVREASKRQDSANN